METPTTDLPTLIDDINNGLEFIVGAASRGDYEAIEEEIKQIRDLMSITNLPAMRHHSLSLRPTPALAHFNLRRQQIEALMGKDYVPDYYGR